MSSTRTRQQCLYLVGCSLFLATNSYAQNVGIGTPNPSHKLHVVGEARISSLSGAGTRMVVADGNGVLSTQALPPAGDITGVTAGAGLINGGTTGTVTVDAVAINGLTTNPNDIRLGGTLIQGTTIDQGAFNMTYNLTGTGDFVVQDAGTGHFEVRDDGSTHFGGDVFWEDEFTGGTLLASIVDVGAIHGLFDLYANGLVQHRLHSTGVSVINEQGLPNSDFRIESDNQANIFFVNAGTNRIGIQTAAPTSMLHMVNGGVNVGANSMASFENTGAEGVAVNGYNTSVTNTFNAC